MEVGGLPFGPDPDLTLTDGPHETGIVDQISDESLPLPAVDVGRVAWSSADGRLLPGDGSSDGGITAGFQRWNTDGNVEDQYETFNGMPVYYGGNLYDSEDSDWDDPYALASAAYVEDYNDSLTATTDENDPHMNDFYQQLVSSEDENYFDSDNGSVTDLDGSMSEGEYCVVSDEGSMADLDVDRLDNVDYDVDREMNVYDRRLCLLWPVGTADLRILQDRFVGDLRMNHSRTISWDPGSRILYRCVMIAFV